MMLYFLYLPSVFVFSDFERSLAYCLLVMQKSLEDGKEIVVDAINIVAMMTITLRFPITFIGNIFLLRMSYLSLSLLPLHHLVKNNIY